MGKVGITQIHPLFMPVVQNSMPLD